MRGEQGQKTCLAMAVLRGGEAEGQWQGEVAWWGEVEVYLGVVDGASACL